MEKFLSTLSDIVWNPGLVVLLLLAGLYFSIRTGVLQVLLLGSVVFGAATEPSVVWELGDIGTGLMTWITVISIIILSPKAFKALKEYEQALSIKK